MIKEEVKNWLASRPTYGYNHIDDQYQKQIEQPQEDKL
jgi:hypothetical protein